MPVHVAVCWLKSELAAKVQPVGSLVILTDEARVVGLVATSMITSKVTDVPLAEHGLVTVADLVVMVTDSRLMLRVTVLVVLQPAVYSTN